LGGESESFTTWGTTDGKIIEQRIDVDIDIEIDTDIDIDIDTNRYRFRSSNIYIYQQPATIGHLSGESESLTT